MSELRTANNVLHRIWEGGRENTVVLLQGLVAPAFPYR